MRIAAFILAFLLSGSALAQKETPVRFALDWRFEGPAAPYLVAIDKGYYKAEGLNVTIDPGTGSVEGINRVASGAYDVGFCDINLLVKYRDNPRNLPVKMVMMVYDTPAFSIITLKKNGIAKPKDLEGKILGAPAGDGAWAQWPIFVQANKIDASKVKVENIGFPVREPMLAQGKVDAITGFWFSSYMNLKAQGIAPEEIVVLHMRDWGLDLYGNGNGFGWVQGDVIGAQIVSVPMTLALSRANHSLLAFVATLSAVFLVMLVALNVLMHFFILKPMQRITTLARDVSAGKPDVPEYAVKGRDEIASLGRSFNLMHRSLQNAMRMLESQ